MTLDQIYGLPEDVVSDAELEPIEEGEQYASGGKLGALRRLAEMATKPNPLRPASIADNLIKMSRSGDLFKKHGELPEIPPIQYYDDPELKRLFGVKTNKVIADGAHRSLIGAKMGAPIEGEQLPLLYNAQGEPETFFNGIRTKAWVPPAVSKLDIQMPSTIVSSKDWSPSLNKLQANALGELATRDFSFPEFLKEITEGGKHVEEGRIFPKQHLSNLGGHPYEFNDSGIDPIYLYLQGEARRYAPEGLNSYKDVLDVVNAESTNPQLKWSAEKALQHPEIVKQPGKDF